MNAECICFPYIGIVRMIYRRYYEDDLPFNKLTNDLLKCYVYTFFPIKVYLIRLIGSYV